MGQFHKVIQTKSVLPIEVRSLSGLVPGSEIKTGDVCG